MVSESQWGARHTPHRAHWQQWTTSISPARPPSSPGTKGWAGHGHPFLSAGADVVTAPAARRRTGSLTVGGRVCGPDVRDPEQVAGVVTAAVERTGRVDTLINNAGGAPPADSATVSPRFNEKIVALNLMAPMAFSQAVYPVMQNQDSGGVILNISSVSGIRPNPMGIAYGAAKAGLLNLSETLAVEWGPKIRVLTVTVGLIVTEDAYLYYGDDAGIAAVGETSALGVWPTGRRSRRVPVLASPHARWCLGPHQGHGAGRPPIGRPPARWPRRLVVVQER